MKNAGWLQALMNFYYDCLLEQAPPSFSEKIKHFFFAGKYQGIARRNDLYLIDRLNIFLNGYIIPEMTETKHDDSFIVISFVV